jgi:two-component system heavy metal sensor histidine kinase CusS
VAESRRRWSLAARLTAWYTGSAFVLTLSAIGFLYWALVSTLEREDDQFLTDKARVIAGVLRDAPGDDRELQHEMEREAGSWPTGQLYLRVRLNGRTAAETPGMTERLPPEHFPADGRAVELKSGSGQSFRAVAMATDGGRPGVVQVAMDRTAEEELLFRYRWFAGVTVAVSLVSCGVLGYTLARRGLRPLREITEAAGRVRSSTLHQRLDTAALPEELDSLAGTFNEMLDRLESSFRRLERFSADIAHELRTPVNNLRGEAEVALSQPRAAADYREVLASGLEEFGRLTGLIDSLLFLARAENPHLQLARQRLEIGRELGIVREFYEAAATEAGIELVVDAADGLQTELDRTLFQRAIGNLVANALAHTPRGGRVMLAAGRIDGDVHVEVADNGSGIAPEHLPHVFDRFYRADPARVSGGGSVGLGLALVRTIATLHGATCTIASEVGRGTRVRLTFSASRTNE